MPVGETLHFGVEFNFAGLPAGADDRFFRDVHDNRLGQLGTRLDLSDVSGLGLTDEWLGIAVDLAIDRPSSMWTYPIETVSQSEAGFELVHQSVVVHPHWFVQADAEGRWSVKMTLAIDTSAAEVTAANRRACGGRRIGEPDALALQPPASFHQSTS